MALYRKGAGQGLLFIGGSLAHDADCCCSACNDAIVIDCCVRGSSFPADECECESLGGHEITAETPCEECTDTIISCCKDGNILEITSCDCQIIGGVINPASCNETVGDCPVCTNISIYKILHPVIINCQGLVDCTYPCETPCVNYFNCLDVVGDCVHCSPSDPYPNAYFCSFSYDQLTYNYEIYEYNGTCNNEILDLSGPTPYYINACNATGLFNLTQLDIQYQTNRCGTYVLQNKQQSILSVENSGCFILDSTVIGDVSTPTTETCESC